MASQFQSDDDSNSVDDDSLQFYSKFGNEVDVSRRTEVTSRRIFLNSASSGLLPIINRAETILNYRTKQYRPLKRLSARLHPLTLLGGSTSIGTSGGGGRGDSSSSGSSSSRSSDSNNSNKLENFSKILPKKIRKLNNANNDGNNSLKATDASINGFKNFTSTNYEPKFQNKIHQRRTKNLKIENLISEARQLHNHQTRSIIDSNNIPRAEEITNSGSTGISLDRVEVSYIEPTIPVTTVLAISLFGIIILCVVIIFWLKNLLFQRGKCRQQEYNQNFHLFGSDQEDETIDNSENMDNGDLNSYHNANMTRTDSNNVKSLVNSPVDELNSNLGDLALNQTPRNEVLLVDKKSSPIALELNTGSNNSRFIFTPIISSSLSTATMNPSLFTENQIAGTISIPVPVPVPVPVPIPIPVPIPSNHKQFFLHDICRTEEIYQNQQDSQVICKLSTRPTLVKSSSTTSPTSSSCQYNISAGTIAPSNSSRSRRFSLCERRSKSPLAMTTLWPNSLKAHSTSLLTHLRHEEQHSTVGAQTNSAQSADTCIQQIYYRTDDKENEIPAGGEVYSPKMKQSEQVLAEQNSPRNFESSTTSMVTRFTFSPKQMVNNSENNTSSPGMLAINCQSSPLLSSAAYRHGNYFKFPEVDCLTPVKVNKVESPLGNSSKNNEQRTPSSDGDPATLTPKSASPSKTKVNMLTQTNQATRRARLKSISLDSDGARLVEDNLGVPVEELIEIANQSPTLVDDCFIFDGKTEHVIASNTEDSTVSLEKGFTPITPSKSNSKNKNNLKISLKSDCSFGAKIPIDDHTEEIKLTPSVQTPKTPTLTQTKQKAISLDSSDTQNIIYCLPSSSNVVAIQQRQLSNSSTSSLQQISSISVPTTPKRQQQLLMSSSERKLQSGKSIKNRVFSISTKTALSKSTTSTPSTSFDHDNTQKTSGFINKLRSFNENTINDGYYDEHFYLDSDGGEMVIIGKRATMPQSRELSSDMEDESCGTGTGFIASNSNLLGANLQNQKCLSSLSLSNNNLKTLPEVMTINDFSTDTQEQQYLIDDRKNIKLAITPTFCSTSNVNGTGIQKTPRNSILQRRGSNHSLTLNLNGSLGSLTKSLSVSNYSLGNTNLQTSQCNLSGSSSNLSHTAPSTIPMTLTQQSLASHHISTTNKKNLLQRRGSNTSLTLNIKGSSCMNLNRFNSHSSLNISSMQHQPHTQQLQHNQQNQPHHSLGGGTIAKKGLLERRNSNASLTLNIHNRALSISNCNLRGSACSLSSVNTNPMDYDVNLQLEQHTDQESHQQYDLHYSTATKYRKFLSSENLNNITQCSKLNQTHVRNLTKTCFGSVSDLKPHPQQQQQQHHQQPFQTSQFNYNSRRAENDSTGNASNVSSSKLNNFDQSNLCSCTGVRNITTKPLSPQSTSEDFKMYLANIQLLQNATNVLNDDHLRKLSFIFEKNYNIEKEIAAVVDTAPKLSIADECANDDIIDITIKFEVPSDDEQKLLLRNLHQEFWDLPTNYQEKPLVFGSQSKNRYKTILPNEHSRVILDCEPGHAQEPYINANYIKGPDYTQNSYIATQGPMSNTIYEYWLMIFQNIRRFHWKGKQQQATTSATKDALDTWNNTLPIIMSTHGDRNTTKISNNSIMSSSGDSGNNFCQKIFMLTNFVENNRQKCSVYFPIDEHKVILITSTNEKIDSGPLIEFYTETLKKDGEFFEEITISLDGRYDLDQLPKVNWFVIKNCDIRKKNGFTIRKLLCLYCQVDNCKTIKQRCHKFICYHYWFPDWPDHRSPNDIDVLLDMSLHLLNGRCEAEFCEGRDDDDRDIIDQQYFENQPLPVIHCSAGIGRTGCLAAILNGLRQMKLSLLQYSSNNVDLVSDSNTRGDNALQNSLHKNCINVDVLGIVCNLRLQRGGMVQNSEQYELIHRALCLYLKRLDMERVDDSDDQLI